MRGVGQVAAGKPAANSVHGACGIGKGSIATETRFLAERDHGLTGDDPTIGGRQTPPDGAPSVINATTCSRVDRDGSGRAGLPGPRRHRRLESRETTRTRQSGYQRSESVLNVSRLITAMGNALAGPGFALATVVA